MVALRRQNIIIADRLGMCLTEMQTSILRRLRAEKDATIETYRPPGTYARQLMFQTKLDL